MSVHSNRPSIMRRLRSLATALSGVAAATTLSSPACAFVPPPNDECASPTEIPIDALNFNPPLLDTTEANAAPTEPQENCEVGNVGVSNTVWYRFTPCIGGTMSLNTIGSNYNTVLTVFGGTCAAAGQIFCSDDIGGGNMQSQLSNLNVTAGTSYHIKVSDYNLSPGGGMLDFNLSYTPIALPNDECTLGLMIASNIASFHPAPYCTVGANSTATEPQEDCEFGGEGVSHTVWYTFQPCGNGTLNINTFGSDYDTVLSVFRGSCAMPILVACNDNSGTGQQSAIANLSLGAALVYRIKIAADALSPGGMLKFNLSYNAACSLGFCAADVAPPTGGDGVVNIDDLLSVINHWGACPMPCPPFCAGDVTRNCVVNIDDLLGVINAWGNCP